MRLGNLPEANEAATQATANRLATTTNCGIGLELGDKWSRLCIPDKARAAMEEDLTRSTQGAPGERLGDATSMRFVFKRSVVVVARKLAALHKLRATGEPHDSATWDTPSIGETRIRFDRGAVVVAALYAQQLDARDSCYAGISLTFSFT
jgi:hypothetical protein